MAHEGKCQLTIVFSVPPDQVDEGDRIFQSHGPWMAATHDRSGDKALFSYTVSKTPERTNPMDPNSAPTGNTCFILTEVYETEAGVHDHFQRAESWQDFAAVGKWLENCTMAGAPAATIVNSLW